jgi:hypothetical protein
MATNDTQDEFFEAVSFGKQPSPFAPNGNSLALAEETSDNAKTEEAPQ